MFEAGLAVENSGLLGTGLFGKGNLQGVSGKGDFRGVYGSSPVTNTAQSYGVYGETKSRSDGATGVYGLASRNYGMGGHTYGVYGESRSDISGSAGVYGTGNRGVYGTGPVDVYGESTSGTGVYGRVDSSAGYAGEFYGRLNAKHSVEGGADDFTSGVIKMLVMLQ